MTNMPILNYGRGPRRDGQGRNSSGGPRRINRPLTLHAGVPSRRRVIAPRLSPQMLPNALAVSRNAQVPAVENATREVTIAEATAFRTSIAETPSMETTIVETTASEVNVASADSEGSRKDEDAEAQIEVWTGSPADGVSQTRHLVILYKAGRPPRSSDARDIPRYQSSVRAFFWWLELEAIIRPSFQDRLQLGQVLDMFDRPEFQGIPEDLRATAKTLRQRFDEENWGREDEGYASDASNDNDTPMSPGGPSSAAVSRPGQGVSNIHPPPPNHPIYGRNGIMHGVICYRSPKKGVTYKLNPACGHEKVSAAVIGHNGLIPGDWWPLQMVALFRGAHGKSQGGIFGSVSMGVYSIVISTRSKKYHEIDEDAGNMLYYSTDNKGVAATSVGTQALDKSSETRQPVRVLRRGDGKSHGDWAPSCGIRYDGLYEVTGKAVVQQNNGDRWFRYTLRRIPGQRDLQEIVGSSPTQHQRNDCEKVKDSYPGAAM